MPHVSRLVTPLLWALCLALLATAAWLFLLNPTVARPQGGPDAGCSAAYDTVLNGADNVPGGERAVDAEGVGKACRQVGKDAFACGVGLVVAAAVLGAWTVRRSRRARRQGRRGSSRSPRRPGRCCSEPRRHCGSPEPPHPTGPRWGWVRGW